MKFTGIPLGVAQHILYPPELRLILAKIIFFMLELHFGTGFLVRSSQAVLNGSNTILRRVLIMIIVMVVTCLLPHRDYNENNPGLIVSSLTIYLF